MAVDKLLGYVFALFVTKTYGPADFGLYLFGVSLIEILLLTSKLGVDRSAIRAIASLAARGKRVEIKSVARAALIIIMPMGLIAAAALLLFNARLAAALDRPRLAAFLSLAALAVPASLFADIFLWTTEGLGLQRYFVIVRTMIEPAVKVSLAALLFFVFGSSARWLAVAYIASIFTSAILSFAVYQRVVARKATGPSSERLAGELLREGLPVCGQMVVSRLLAQADIFLIFTFVSASATAHYTVAMRTAMLTAMLPFAMEAAFRPAAAAILAKGDALRPLYRSVSRSVLMLCLPASIALILFPERVMAVVGSQFIEAAPVARLIALGTLVYFILGPSGQTLTMAARPRVPFINGLIAGAAGLALNIILIPRVGLIGAGIALCSSWAVSNVMNALAMKRILGVSGVGPRHAPLLLAAIAAAVVALIADSIAPADKYIALAVIGAAMVATYAATLLLMGIAEEDKQFLRSVLLIRSK